MLLPGLFPLFRVPVAASLAASSSRAIKDTRSFSFKTGRLYASTAPPDGRRGKPYVVRLPFLGGHVPRVGYGVDAEMKSSGCKQRGCIPRPSPGGTASRRRPRPFPPTGHREAALAGQRPEPTWAREPVGALKVRRCRDALLFYATDRTTCSLRSVPAEQNRDSGCPSAATEALSAYRDRAHCLICRIWARAAPGTHDMTAVAVTRGQLATEPGPLSANAIMARASARCPRRAAIHARESAASCISG